MALVSGGFVGSITLADSGNNRSTLQYTCNPATVTTFTLAQTAMASIAIELAAITNSVVTAYSVSEVFREDTITLPNDAENENKASVSFIKNDGMSGNLKIPAPIDGLFAGAAGSGSPYNQVDLTDAGLVAYTDRFRAGNDFVISDGEFLVALVRGKRVHAKNNYG